MTTKHTPGPWNAVGTWVENQNEDFIDVYICTCDSEIIGQSYLGRSDAEDRANARLIAAAPDLLEACQGAAHILQYCPDKQEKAVALLLAAIAKAKGDRS